MSDTKSVRSKIPENLQIKSFCVFIKCSEAGHLVVFGTGRPEYLFLSDQRGSTIHAHDIREELFYNQKHLRHNFSGTSFLSGNLRKTVCYIVRCSKGEQNPGKLYFFIEKKKSIYQKMAKYICSMVNYNCKKKMYKRPLDLLHSEKLPR